MHMKNIPSILFFLGVVYLVISTMVFAIRHSFMTDMERLMYVPEALKFEKISYKEIEEWRNR